MQIENSDYTWNNINDNQIIMDDNWFYKYDQYNDIWLSI